MYITSVRDAVVVLQSMEFEVMLAISWLVNSCKAFDKYISGKIIKNNILSKTIFKTTSSLPLLPSSEETQEKSISICYFFLLLYMLFFSFCYYLGNHDQIYDMLSALTFCLSIESLT